MSSVLRANPGQLTTARVNDHPVEVHQSHRRWTTNDYVPGAPESTWYEPVLVTVCAGGRS